MYVPALNVVKKYNCLLFSDQISFSSLQVNQSMSYYVQQQQKELGKILF